MIRNALFAMLASGMMMNVNASATVDVDSINIMVHLTEEYVKIKSSELTPPVVEEILKEYPTSKLGAAYKNDNGDFKLIMVLKSGTRRTVYIDKYGNWMTKK